MSRGIRDLREIICVSRLNNIQFNDDISIINSNLSSSEKQSVKISNHTKSNKNNQKKRALPNINISTVHNSSDELMKYIKFVDDKCMSEWLNKANRQLHELMIWAQDHNVYVNFMNFWLAEMSTSQRRELFSMEHDIVEQQVAARLTTVFQDGEVVEQISQQLVRIGLWEYPENLCSTSADSSMLLGYLDTLTSGRSDSYRSLLTHVPVTTRDTHFIQCLLSVRAFALLSICTAVVSFHANLVSRNDIEMQPLETLASSGPGADLFQARLTVALRHQLLPCLQYWLARGRIDLQKYRDPEGRNLLLLAVSFNSSAVVAHLIRKFDVSGIINKNSEAGNCALHLAVCQGNLELVRMLVTEGHADVNVANASCENCTPLHMAVMYGQGDIVRFLIDNGANVALRTDSGATAADMARIYEQTEMASLLEQMQHQASLDPISILDLHGDQTQSTIPI